MLTQGLAEGAGPAGNEALADSSSVREARQHGSARSASGPVRRIVLQFSYGRYDYYPYG
jgi:hypothetical protein